MSTEPAPGPIPIAARLRLPAHPGDGMTQAELLELRDEHGRLPSYPMADGGVMLADEYHLNLEHPTATLADVEAKVAEAHPGIPYSVDEARQCIRLEADPGDEDPTP